MKVKDIKNSSRKTVGDAGPAGILQPILRPIWWFAALTSLLMGMSLSLQAQYVQGNHFYVKVSIVELGTSSTRGIGDGSGGDVDISFVFRDVALDFGLDTDGDARIFPFGQECFHTGYLPYNSAYGQTYSGETLEALQTRNGVGNGGDRVLAEKLLRFPIDEGFDYNTKPILRFFMDCFENDRGSDCAFDGGGPFKNGDDHHAAELKELALPRSGEMIHVQVKESVATYWAKLKLEYSFQPFEPLMKYTTAAGDPLTTVCEGEDYYLEVNYLTEGFTGRNEQDLQELDYFAYWVESSSADKRIPFFGWNIEGIEMVANNAKGLRFRIPATYPPRRFSFQLNRDDGLAFGHPYSFIVKTPTKADGTPLLNVIPTPPNDLTFELPPVCEGAGNEHSIRILDVPGAVPDEVFNFTLERKNVNCDDPVNCWALFFGAPGGPNRTITYPNPVTDVLTSYTGLPEGEYRIKVTKPGGTGACTYIEYFELKKVPLPEFGLQVGTVSCQNELTALEASFAYTEWPVILRARHLQTGEVYEAQSTILGVPVGEYQVELENAAGCATIYDENVVVKRIDSAEVEIVSLDRVEVNGVTYDALCGDDLARVAIIPKGEPQQTYFLSWEVDGASGGNRSFESGEELILELPAGQYIFRFSGINTCSVTRELEINIPDQPLSVGAVSITSASACTFDGQIALPEVSGGVPPYTYSLNGGAPDSDSQFTGLWPGYHLVEITDAIGCSILTNNFIDSEQSLQVDTVLHRDLRCVDDADGRLEVLVSGGTPPYSYQLNDGEFTAENFFEQLSGGNYTLTIQDAAGCAITHNADILQPFAIDIRQINTGRAHCPGDPVSVYVSVSGGSGEFQFAIDGGAFTSPDHSQWITEATNWRYVRLDNILPGNHNLQIRDTAGCLSRVTTFAVEDPEPLELVVSSVKDLSCREMEMPDGRIQLVLSGGYSPYTLYLFEEAMEVAKDTFSFFYEQNYTVSGLQAGAYHFQLLDAGGCTVESTEGINISEPIALTATAVNSGDEVILCGSASNGEITVSATGGTAPYEYALNYGDFQDNPVLPFAGVSNLYQVRDANGCVFSDSISLPTVEGISIEVLQTVAQTDCELGRVQVRVENFTGDLEVLAQIANPLSPCRGILHAKDTFEVIEAKNAKGDVEVLSYTLAKNNNGNVDTTFWIEGLTTSPLGWCITVTDQSGCNASAQANIGRRTLSLTATGITAASCADQSDGTVDIQLSGGTSYTLIHNYQDTVLLESASSMEVINTAFQELAPGLHLFVLLDEEGCQASLEVEVEHGNTLYPAIDQINGSGCGLSDYQADVNFSFSGGSAPYTISWPENTPGIGNEDGTQWQGLPAGEYEVLVSDAGGCQDSITVYVEAQDTLALEVVKLIAPDCINSGAEVELGATGGTPPYVYMSDTGEEQNNGVFGPLDVGTYLYIVRDATGCQEVVTFEVVPFEQGAVEVLPTPASCNSVTDGGLEIAFDGRTDDWTYQLNGEDITLSTNKSIQGLPAGLYTLVINSGNGCELTFENLEITEPAALQSTVEVLQGATCGLNNAAAFASVNGGTAPYQYSWNFNTIPEQDTTYNLFPGENQLIVTDAQGCLDTQIVMINTATPLHLFLQATPASCGENNGGVDLNIAGGQAPFSISWTHDPDLTATSITDLAPGTYEVVVTDAGGCPGTASVEVQQLEPLGLSLAAMSPQICDVQLGTISLESRGGDGNYEYTWSHDAELKTAIAEGLSASAYSATVTDGQGCESSIFTEVAFAGSPSVHITSITSTNCSESSGSIAVTVAGGNTPYHFTWSHDQDLNEAFATQLAVGNYTLVVEDNNGCQTTVDTSIVAADAPTITVVDTQDSPCHTAEGSMEILVSGGTMPYAYSWAHAPLLNQAVASDLSPGNYSVTVTDFKGCSAVVSGTVAATGGPLITIDSLSNSVCEEGTGYISVIVENGIAPFDYQWDYPDAGNTPVLDHLSSGIYSLTLTDSGGCTGTFLQEILLEEGPSVAVMEKDSSFCEEPNGRLLLVTQGNGPFTYAWNHDSQLNSPEATSLTSGTYTVTVTDGNGCIDQINETLPVLLPPSLTLADTSNNSCGEEVGSISYTIADGTEPYFISWSHDPTLNSLVANQLEGGIYGITVEDSNGCLVSAETEIINENGPEAILEITDSPCTEGNGTMTVAISGGAAPFTYQWSHDETATGPQVTGLNSGAYSVTVTDKGQCQTIAMGTVGLQPGPEVSLQAVKNSFCEEGNGNIRLQTTGSSPFTYRWSHDPDLNLNVAGGLVSDNYIVTVTDVYNCETVVTHTVAFIEGPKVSIAELTPSFCDEDNGNIMLTAPGDNSNYNYAWSHDADLIGEQATGLAPGNYQIMVSDTNGCFTTIDTTVGVFAAPELDVVRVQGSTCAAANGEIEVMAQGGLPPYQYTWFNIDGLEGNIATELSGGTYPVIVEDSRGCKEQLEVVISNTDGPNVALDSFKNSFCTNDNGFIHLNILGGVAPYSYQWNHDTELQSGKADQLSSGIYDVVVQDANNCIVNATYTIGFETAPGMSILGVENSYCGPGNGQIKIDPIGVEPIAISWSHDPQLKVPVADSLTAGDYTVVLTDANQCQERFEFSIVGTAAVQIGELETVRPSCNGSDDGRISFDLSGCDGNYQITWSHDPLLHTTTAVGLSSGNYQVSVVDDDGCSIEQLIELPTVPALSINPTLTPPSCFGMADGSIAVEPMGGNGDYGYRWSVTGAADSSSLYNIQAGIYQLTLTDAEGCTLEREFALAETTTAIRINLEEDSVLKPTCAGDDSGSLTVTVSGGAGNYNYAWSNGATGTTLHQITNGNYVLTVTDIAGCTEQFSYVLEAGGELSTDLVFNDTTICEGTGVTYDFTTEDYNFEWIGPNGYSSTNKQVKLSGAGVYTVRISSGNCVLEESFQLQVDPEPFQTLFIVPTEVVMGDTVVAYEVSWPTPDHINWQFDQDSIVYVRQDQNQHFFHFPYEGEFELGLAAGLNACSDLLLKTIRVVADSSQLDLPLDPGTREFESIQISPNPNNGEFEVAIEMTRPIDLELRVFNALSDLQATQTGNGQQSYRFSFSEDLPPGAYLLFVRGEQEQRALTFVVVK